MQQLTQLFSWFGPRRAEDKEDKKAAVRSPLAVAIRPQSESSVVQAVTRVTAAHLFGTPYLLIFYTNAHDSVRVSMSVRARGWERRDSAGARPWCQVPGGYPPLLLQATRNPRLARRT